MKTLYILEARWHDKLNRVRKNKIIGVFDNLESLEKFKTSVSVRPHDYHSESFSVYTEIQPFHA
jgi:hypothetical protein